MKYKVGDKVKVRSDLKIDEIYGGETFVEEMAVMLGKKVTIERVNDDSYAIKEDGWSWTDEMLEPTTLSTGDMLNELAKNPGAKYRSEGAGTNEFIASTSEHGRLVLTNSKTGVRVSDTGNIHLANTKWTLVKPEPKPKPVPFMEAFVALDNQGKNIEWRDTHSDKVVKIGTSNWFGAMITPYMVMRGKWYILED